MSQKQTKSQRQTWLSLLKPQKNSKLHSHNIYSEVLGQTDTDTLFAASVSVITYEAWLVDYVGHVLNTYTSNNHSVSYSMEIPWVCLVFICQSVLSEATC